ncbi:MAG: amino acid ABC transporter substrate-binding protein [Chloroflexi bacterium]|nr:amino acid ABC transporter substrate-binding protein [Chloroflexota bacterium]
MSRSIARYAGLGLMLALFVLLVAACATPPPPPPTPATSAPQPPAATSAPAGGATKPIVIGFTASQTGNLNVESKKQTQGLQLWLDDVKKAGGIKLSDGTVVMPEIKFYDDESKTDRVQALYTKLINEDKVDFLISPYSSGLTKAAAVVSEQNDKVMLTTGAADDKTMEQGFKGTYQLYTPASRYLAGAIDLLKKLEPNAKKIAIVNEKDSFSTTVANEAKAYATAQGFEVVLAEGYDTGTTDFAPFINKIAAANPDAIMGGGHFQDGTTFAKQLYEKKVPVKMIALLVAPADAKFTEIGAGAEGVIAPSQWETPVTYSPESAKAANLPWYGPTVSAFVDGYKAKYNEAPSYHAAGGYAAGLLLQKALEDANSTDAAKVKAALDTLNLLTFYGQIKFSTDAKTHGKQAGHTMVYIQWQKGADGKLAKQIVFPLEAKTADAQARQ